MEKNKIEVGEYVRTKDGRIFKVFKIDTKKENENLYSDEYTRPINYKITKHSKNIIDLIEVGDYVNGSYVLSIGISGNIEDIITIESGADEYGEEELRNKDIISIVTKEQFASVEFRLEEDNNG